ncbi:MAG TPA: phosphoribosylformylglycinamidine cyclo-ligase [Fimbriimonas sp.]|nr:phosphoribosylformylglycinamidine cyclo-ligase [Fimbriimonas sp.]
MADELTYAAAGVNIDEAQRALRGVVDKIHATRNDSVLGGVGGFGALYKGMFPGYENPLIVSSIDGVGTKTKVASMAGDFSNLGADIVNHCVNDILCQGAKPLFFLDYFACSKLNATVFDQVISSMAEACGAVGCALIGGETAEMPGVYHEEEIDVVGTIVGIVDTPNILPRTVTAGDVVIGVASNGLHTNGFSLARRALFEVGGLSVRDTHELIDGTIGEVLLRPHRCYYNSVYPLLQEPAVRAIAHLTGGGFYDNIPRVLPASVKVMIEKRSWEPSGIFRLIQEAGAIADHEMYRTFNMGIGMTMFVDRYEANKIVDILNGMGEHAAVIGEVQSGNRDVQIV